MNKLLTFLIGAIAVYIVIVSFMFTFGVVIPAIIS